jgi:cyclase
MFRPRVIPCLLIRDGGLVKSVRFDDFRYIGDPINAVHIFNRKKADELIFLDTQASTQSRRIDLALVEQIGDECDMPFAVGGGVTRLQDIRELVAAGAEKICVNTAACTNPSFIRQAADAFGSSTIVVSIDVKRRLMGGWEVRSHAGRKATGLEPRAHATAMAAAGAGEILVNAIDRDGTMAGYDLELIRGVAAEVSVPVIALGGAGSLEDVRQAVLNGASAAAAGSLFVFHGPRRGVLISFPPLEDLASLFAGYQPAMAGPKS